MERAIVFTLRESVQSIEIIEDWRKGCPVNRVDFASKIHPLFLTNYGSDHGQGRPDSQTLSRRRRATAAESARLGVA
jgi:hypothetical protein